MERLKNKLIKGLNEEYYLAASGATRSNDNRNLVLSINEAKYISNLLDLESKRSEIERKAFISGVIRGSLSSEIDGNLLDNELDEIINRMYNQWKESQNVK